MHRWLRPNEAQNVLVDLASNGAFAGNSKAQFLNPEEDLPGLDYLLHNRLVRGLVGSNQS